MEYFNEVRSLSIVIFKLISESLDLDFDVAFKRFCTDEACAVRLLHYPPQKIDASEDQLGTGAHTDLYEVFQRSWPQLTLTAVA